MVATLPAWPDTHAVRGARVTRRSGKLVGQLCRSELTALANVRPGQHLQTRAHAHSTVTHKPAPRSPRGWGVEPCSAGSPMVGPGRAFSPAVSGPRRDHAALLENPQTRWSLSPAWCWRGGVYNAMCAWPACAGAQCPQAENRTLPPLTLHRLLRTGLPNLTKFWLLFRRLTLWTDAG